MVSWRYNALKNVNIDFNIANIHGKLWKFREDPPWKISITRAWRGIMAADWPLVSKMYLFCNCVSLLSFLWECNCLATIKMADLWIYEDNFTCCARYNNNYLSIYLAYIYHADFNDNCVNKSLLLLSVYMLPCCRDYKFPGWVFLNLPDMLPMTSYPTRSQDASKYSVGVFLAPAVTVGERRELWILPPFFFGLFFCL